YVRNASFTFFPSTRPQPTPTLFPYTTLFRSVPSKQPMRIYDTRPCLAHPSKEACDGKLPKTPWDAQVSSGKNGNEACLDGTMHRSEEHTSELQSLAYLVCRLLLEKKKNLVHS